MDSLGTWAVSRLMHIPCLMVYLAFKCLSQGGMIAEEADLIGGYTEDRTSAESLPGTEASNDEPLMG